MRDAKIISVSDDLFLISLPAPIPGFEDFLSVWVKTGTPSFIVDVGPSSTVKALEAALEQLAIRSLDYILLTHIHLDHAGAIGHISRLFSNTPVICHPAAVTHLADPAKLWEGSVKTLGSTALVYGEIIPTSIGRLVNAEEFDTPSIEVFITPGHAPHQIAFLHAPYLFAGEACGVHIRSAANEIYHRPATPPKFFLETTLQSIDLLLNQNPEKICFGHFGMEENAVFWLESHKKQLLLWKTIIEEMMNHEDEKDFFRNCLNRLIDQDPLMRGFRSFSENARKREFDLIRNSIKGYLGFLKSSKKP